MPSVCWNRSAPTVACQGSPAFMRAFTLDVARQVEHQPIASSAARTLAPSAPQNDDPALLCRRRRRSPHCASARGLSSSSGRAALPSPARGNGVRPRIRQTMRVTLQSVCDLILAPVKAFTEDSDVDVLCHAWTEASAICSAHICSRRARRSDSHGKSSAGALSRAQQYRSVAGAQPDPPWRHRQPFSRRYHLSFIRPLALAE